MSSTHSLTVPAQRRPTIPLGPALCVGLALALVLLLGAWGAYQDWVLLGHSVLNGEINRFRSHAIRTTTRLERQLSESDKGLTLEQAAQDPWLRDHWSRFIPPPDSVHGAVIDLQGKILAHSDPRRVGGQLCPDWDEHPILDAGPDVFSTNCLSLTGGPWTLDITVPILQDGQVVGTYHAGASQDWIEGQVSAARKRSAVGWSIVIGGIIAVVLLSSFLLYRMTRQSALLEAALRQSHSRRLAELNYLMIGMAHEVRNPLNAVRLNLFTADRVFRGEAGLDTEEVSTMLGESVREIERVDSLMTLLLGYARADDLESVTVDIAQEVRSALQFLTPTFQTRGVTLLAEIDEEEEYLTRAGRGQVRQVLLNLLNNAADAVPRGTGKIVVSLERVLNVIALTVTDNGTGIPPQHRERLFSPFFTTKDEGTGLGLALVRSLVERAGGQAECRSAEPGCCQFRITWPALSSQPVRRSMTA